MILFFLFVDSGSGFMVEEQRQYKEHKSLDGQQFAYRRGEQKNIIYHKNIKGSISFKL
jgi:hypothetical protein